MKAKMFLFQSAGKLFWWTGVAWLSEWQARNWRAVRSVNEGRSSWGADVFTGLWDLKCLGFRLAHDRLADFFGLTDGARLADDFRIGDDSLHVDNLGFRHNTRFPHHAGLSDRPWLVHQTRLADFFRLWHDVLVNHSALRVDDLLLANNPRRLLNFDELWSALLRWADSRALRHRAEVLLGVALWSALRMRKGRTRKHSENMICMWVAF